MKKKFRLALALILLACGATAQAQTSAKQMTGSWSLVSLETDTAEGRIQPFGSAPVGYIYFAPNGRFGSQFMRADVPMVAANNRLKATAEENVAIALGSVAFFGEWKLVDPKTGEVRLHIIGSSYPNWNGADQTRFIKVSGDAMTLLNPSSPAAGKSTVMLTRIR